MPLADAVFKFWADLFDTDAPPGTAIALWVRDILTGVESAAAVSNERIAALPAIDAARVSVMVAGLKVELTLADDAAIGKPVVKRSRLFASGISSAFYPAWTRANPIGNFIASKAKVISADRQDVLDLAVTDLLHFAADKVSARIMAAVRERLADGRWLASGVLASDLTGARLDLATNRARDAHIDISSGRASWPAPIREVLLDVEIRRAAVETPPRPLTQSFAEEDDKLVEEMRQLILNGQAMSAIEAARMVAHKARRKEMRKGREGDNLDSVVERLRRRYGAKYRAYAKV